MAGYSNGSRTDLGVNTQNIEAEPSAMISKVYINSLNTNYPEFLSLYNPSTNTADISGYQIDKGVTCTIPQGTTLEPGAIVYLTDQASSVCWDDITDPVIEWSAGKLSNNGEGLQLLDNNGIVIDFIRYNDDGKWPDGVFRNGEIMTLKDFNIDNHFPESWTTVPIEQQFTKEPTNIINRADNMKIYPNPTTGWVNVFLRNNTSGNIEIYSIMGVLLDEIKADSEHIYIDLSVYDQPIILIRKGELMEKLFLVK
jgi:hypothetical protein